MDDVGEILAAILVVLLTISCAAGLILSLLASAHEKTWLWRNRLAGTGAGKVVFGMSLILAFIGLVIVTAAGLGAIGAWLADYSGLALPDPGFGAWSVVAIFLSWGLIAGIEGKGVQRHDLSRLRIVSRIEAELLETRNTEEVDRLIERIRHEQRDLDDLPLLLKTAKSHRDFLARPAGK